MLFVCSCILERKREKVGNPEKIWHCNEWVVIFTWLAGGYSQAFFCGVGIKSQNSTSRYSKPRMISGIAYGNVGA